MAIGHIAIRPHSRSAGHTAAAALAYRFGVAITCTRTGEYHDYHRRSKRADVVAAGLTPGPFATPADLAAGIETAERRINSRLLRDVQIALPAELSVEDRTALTKGFATDLAKRYNTVTAWAVHRPDRRGDARNHHAHIVLPTRKVEHGRFAEKIRKLDDRENGPIEIDKIRTLWEARANEAMIEAGLEAGVHTGRTSCPAPTLGPANTGNERRAWAKRHKHEPAGLSVEQLVADDCATGRGRRLARHAERQHDASRSIPVPREDLQVPAPLPAAEPAPQARPGRVVIPTARGVRLAALPAAVPAPVPEDRPGRLVVPTGRGLGLAVPVPEPQARPGRVVIPTARGVRLAALPAAVPAPVPEDRPGRVVVPTARGVRLAVPVPEPQARPGRVIVPTARGVRLAALPVAVPVPDREARPGRVVVPTARGVRLAVPVPKPQARPGRVVVPTARGERLAALPAAELVRPAQPPLRVHDPANFLALLASLHEKRRAKAAIEEARRRKREQDTQAAKGTPTAPPTWKVPESLRIPMPGDPPAAKEPTPTPPPRPAKELTPTQFAEFQAALMSGEPTRTPASKADEVRYKLPAHLGGDDPPTSDQSQGQGRKSNRYDRGEGR